MDDRQALQAADDRQGLQALDDDRQGLQAVSDDRQALQAADDDRQALQAADDDRQALQAGDDDRQALQAADAHTRIDPSTLVTVKNFFVSSRSPSLVQLGFFRDDSERLGDQLQLDPANYRYLKIDIPNPPFQIEKYQELVIQTTDIVWKDRETMIANTVEIEPFKGRHETPKIKDLDSSTCRRLASKDVFGPDYVRLIAEDPTILDRQKNLRYSLKKREIIIRACEQEHNAASKVDMSEKRIFDALFYAEGNRVKARHLLKEYVSSKYDSPYRLLTTGKKQTFMTADRFAKQLDPEAAEHARPEAIIIDALLSLAEGYNKEEIGTGHTLPKLPDIVERARLDFALPPSDAQTVVERLLKNRIVTAPIPDLISLEQTETRSFLRQIDGVPFYVEIQSVIRASKQYPDGEIADVLNLETGELQAMKITKVAGSELRKGYPGDGYLGKEFAILPIAPTTRRNYWLYKIAELERDGEAPDCDPGDAPATSALAGASSSAPSTCPDVGLMSFIKAEKTILAFATNVHERPKKDDNKAKIVELAIAKAAKILRRPGFVLDEQQKTAIRANFAYPLSVVTGPPGSGKTTITALTNWIASKVWPDAEQPILGVAYAGRAASVLQNAATLPDAPFTAMTIHRALGIGREADGLAAIRGRKGIDAPALIIDECSMLPVDLLAAVIENNNAEHIVLLGDVDQLPPVGAGNPFTDLIAKDRIAITRLEHNHPCLSLSGCLTW